MFLTSFILDFTGGILWWLTKNTINIVYNGVSYILTFNDSEEQIGITNSITLSEIEFNELRDEIKELKKICLDKK